MKGLGSHTPLIPKGKPPLSFAILNALPSCTYFSTNTTLSQSKFFQYLGLTWIKVSSIMFLSYYFD